MEEELKIDYICIGNDDIKLTYCLFCDCKQILIEAQDNLEVNYRICQRFAMRLWTRHLIFHFLVLTVFRLPCLLGVETHSSCIPSTHQLQTGSI